MTNISPKCVPLCKNSLKSFTNLFCHTGLWVVRLECHGSSRAYLYAQENSLDILVILCKNFMLGVLQSKRFAKNYLSRHQNKLILVWNRYFFLMSRCNVFLIYVIVFLIDIPKRKSLTYVKGRRYGQSFQIFSIMLNFASFILFLNKTGQIEILDFLFLRFLYFFIYTQNYYFNSWSCH